MNKTLLFRAGVILALSFLAPACFAGKDLPTVPAVPADVEGTYTLLLYGCHYPDDIKDLAILVPGNAKYSVDIYDLSTSYKTRKDLSGAEALKEAESFVRCSTRRVTRTEIHRVRDEAGETVAFEVRPLYFPLEFGQEDVFQVSYSLADGRVTVYIRLDRAVQQTLESSGSNNMDGGR